MDKRIELLEQLAQFELKADKLIQLKNEYMKLAVEMDQQWKEFCEKELPVGDRKEVHPSHLAKKLLEVTSPITKG